VTDQGYWLGFSEIVADIGWFENFLDRISAVTVEDVQRVARNYFKPALRNVGWYIPTGTGPAEGEDEDEEAGELEPVAEAEQGVGE
jgi:hypothetical protein